MRKVQARVLHASVPVAFFLLAIFPGAPAHSQAIIIDHTCTDQNRIPDYWLEQAKKLTLHYAHTSHGSQINSGILNL